MEPRPHSTDQAAGNRSAVVAAAIESQIAATVGSRSAVAAESPCIAVAAGTDSAVVAAVSSQSPAAAFHHHYHPDTPCTAAALEPAHNWVAELRIEPVAGRTVAAVHIAVVPGESWDRLPSRRKTRRTSLYKQESRTKMKSIFLSSLEQES